MPAVTPRHVQSGDDWLPVWVREHVQKGSSAVELLRDAVRRVTEDPHREMLLEVEMVINELGRSPENGAHVRAAIKEAAASLLLKPQRGQS